MRVKCESIIYFRDLPEASEPTLEEAGPASYNVAATGRTNATPVKQEGFGDQVAVVKISPSYIPVFSYRRLSREMSHPAEATETSSETTAMQVCSAQSPRRTPKTMPFTPVNSFMKTPLKTPKPSRPVPSSANARSVFKTPTLNTPSSTKNRTTPLKSASAKKLAESPVGLYIRSGPEPVLIENVRPVHSKLIHPSITKQKVAVRNSKGIWTTDQRSTDASDAKEDNVVENQPSFKPVLPVVLHEAAASVVTIHLKFVGFFFN